MCLHETCVEILRVVVRCEEIWVERRAKATPAFPSLLPAPFLPPLGFSGARCSPHALEAISWRSLGAICFRFNWLAGRK